MSREPELEPEPIEQLVIATYELVDRIDSLAVDVGRITPEKRRPWWQIALGMTVAFMLTVYSALFATRLWSIACIEPTSISTNRAWICEHLFLFDPGMRR